MNIFELSHRIRASIATRMETRRWNAYEASKLRRLSRFSGAPAGPIFIFGCQRSGTTHLERLFRSDPRSRVFGEFSDLSITPEHTVWRSQEEMRQILAKQPGAYWVVRSLLASHDTLEILKAWTNSNAIWIIRDANSVVDSMIRKWEGNFREISQRVETDITGHWPLESLWDEIEAQAAYLAPNAEGVARYRDIYALYWAARNSLVFDLNLSMHPRVFITDYADYTRNPEACLKDLWRRIGVLPPEKRYPLETRHSTFSGRQKPRFSPAVQEQCDALYARLRAVSLEHQDMVHSE